MSKDKALRLALKAMKVNNQAWKYLADSGDAGNFDAEEQGYYQLNEQAIIAVEAALEAKVEPVATLEDLEQEIYENTRQFVSFDVMEWMLKRYYTTPPQRTWVGLTDEEIGVCLDVGNGSMGKIISAIQAKLKELNT